METHLQNESDIASPTNTESWAKTTNGIPYCIMGKESKEILLVATKGKHTLITVQAAKKEIKAQGYKVFASWVRL